ncbi:MAG: hypothetical protein AAB795_01635 [Patescibacteria group bacterium]
MEMFLISFSVLFAILVIVTAILWLRFDFSVRRLIVELKQLNDFLAKFKKRSKTDDDVERFITNGEKFLEFWEGRAEINKKHAQ